MLEMYKRRPSPKYAWQQALLDALKEQNCERLPERITAAEKLVSERLVQEPEDANEQLALRGAVIVLHTLQHPYL